MKEVESKATVNFDIVEPFSEVLSRKPDASQTPKLPILPYVLIRHEYGI